VFTHPISNPEANAMRIKNLMLTNLVFRILT